jgi:hypothetical protein
MMHAIREADRSQALLGVVFRRPTGNHSRQQDIFKCGKFW